MNRRRVGTHYEEIAMEYLKQKGYRILEHNYRNKLGEIDIIAVDHETLVAVEVKYRTTSSHGDALEAVDFAKQKKICRTFLLYYTANGYSQDMPCRFDVIGIQADGELHHIENAFEFVY